MSYEVLVDDGKKDNVMMITKTMVRNNIVSSNHQISTKVPVDCLNFSGTFIQSGHLGQSAYNNTECEVLDISTLEFEMNDGNGYMAFNLQNEEILYNYILANGNSPNNNFSLKKLNEGIGYGIGLSFNGSSFDFHNQKFGVSISSGASNVNQYTLFLYFTGIITV